MSALPPASLGGWVTPTPLVSAPDLLALPGTAGRYLYTDERNGGRRGCHGRVPSVSALSPAPLGQPPTPIASVCSSSAARYCREIYSHKRGSSRERGDRNVTAVTNLVVIENVEVDGGVEADEDTSICTTLHDAVHNKVDKNLIRESVQLLYPSIHLCSI